MPQSTTDSINTYDYDAFISYRHSKLDKSWSLWLHRKLERFRMPPSASTTGLRPRLRLFRDDDELSATGDLPEAIRSALGRSRFLIVVCSTSTPASKWVNDEIKHFAAIGRGHSILTLLLNGEPATSFPPALAELDIEPLAADVRPGRFTSRSRQRRAVLKIAAALHGCGFDDLYQRDRMRARRRRKYAIAVAGVFLVSFAFWLRQEIQSSISELATYSDQSINEDASRSVLLSQVAFVKSKHWFGIGHTVARQALERALIASALREYYEVRDTQVRGLAWHVNGLIAAGGFYGNLSAWDHSKGTIAYRAKTQQGVERLIFGPSQEPQIAVAGNRRIINLWDLRSGRVWPLLNTYKGLRLQPSDVAWCSMGQKLASSDGTEVVTVLDPGTGQIRQSPRNPEWGYVNSIVWNRSCDSLAIAAEHGLFLWRSDTNADVLLGRHMNDSVNAAQVQPEGVLRVAWNPNNEVLATGGEDGTVRVWTLSSPGQPEVLSGHSGPVNDVAWSQDGQRLATASSDGTVRIWQKQAYSDLYRAQVIHTGQGRAWSVAWSPDGTEVASGGDDGGIRIWHVSGFPEEVTLLGHHGRLILSEDDQLMLENVPLTDAELLELARRRSVRKLSDEECGTYLHGSCPSGNK